jgi:hypothetical protein
MIDFDATWKQLLFDLQRECDELRLKVQTGRTEARDYLAVADERLRHLRRRTASLNGKVKDARTGAEERAKDIVAEICAVFARVRETL